MKTQDSCQWVRKSAITDGPPSQPEDEAERFIDGSELACVQASNGSSEALGIDNRRLLNYDASRAAVDRYDRAEAGRPCARGRR